MNIDIAAKLFPNITTLIVQLCSTGVLFIVFKKYLWVPVQNYFAKRADFIESQIVEAKEMNEKAKGFMVESENQARESAREYRDIVEKAKSDATKIHDEIISDARKEASAKIKQAEREIEIEKAQAREDLKEEMIDVAIEVASKIMNKEMNSKANQDYVKEFVNKVVS